MYEYSQEYSPRFAMHKSRALSLRDFCVVGPAMGTYAAACPCPEAWAYYVLARVGVRFVCAFHHVLRWRFKKLVTDLQVKPIPCYSAREVTNSICREGWEVKKDETHGRSENIR
jgi:hypothetical protein